MKTDHLPEHVRGDWDELDELALFDLFNQDSREVEHPDGKAAQMTKYDAAWCFGYYSEGDMFVPYVCYSLGAGDTVAMTGEPRATEREAVLTAAQHDKMMRGELTGEELAELGRLA